MSKTISMLAKKFEPLNSNSRMDTTDAAPALSRVVVRMLLSAVAASCGSTANRVLVSWSNRCGSRRTKPAMARIPRTNGNRVLSVPHANRTARLGARSSITFLRNCPAREFWNAASFSRI
jgi:hypothetical protein